MKDEKLVTILRSTKTRDGELCWKHIVFGFGVKTAYYIVYSPYDLSVFDTSDYNNL